MKIYLAGPEVFLPSAHDVFAKKLRLCKKYGVEGVTPFDNEIALYDFEPREAAFAIFKQNIELINKSDAVLANITPFRGVHMDPGTSFEIGYAFAQGKKISAYTQDGRDIVGRTNGVLREPKNPTGFYHDQTANPHPTAERFFDPQGLLVENFGMTENLMIKCALMQNGVLVAVHDLPENQQFYSTLGFEQALLNLLA